MLIQRLRQHRERVCPIELLTLAAAQRQPLDLELLVLVHMEQKSFIRNMRQNMTLTTPQPVIPNAHE